MATELCVHAAHDGGMRVDTSTACHEVRVDYPLQVGDETQGMTSLELLLASLASCAANTLALVLGKMRQPYSGLEVDARGRRRAEHPTVITDIDLAFVVHGDVTPAAVERALTIAEEQLCPVWNMLKDGTPITTSYRVLAD